MTRYSLSFFIFFYILLQYNVNAQNFDYSYSKFSNAVTLKTVLVNAAATSGLTTTTISASHSQWGIGGLCGGSGNWWQKIKFKSLHNWVKFTIDYTDSSLVTNNYTYLVPFTLKGYNDPNNCTNIVTITDTLTVSYNKDSLKAYQNKFFKKYSGFHKMEVTFEKVYLKDPSTGLPILVTQTTAPGFNCKLEAEVWVQFYDKEYYGAGNMPALNVYKDVSNVTTRRELKVSWACPSPVTKPIVRPSMFELEWTYLDNYQCDPNTHLPIPNIATNTLNYDFKNNATRIITKSDSFNIPIIYEKGVIVYRVRMIRPDSVDYLLPITGDWSIPSDSGLLTSSLSNHYYEITTPFMGDSVNWQYSINFAEDGKYKHVVSFYDGLLHNKETTTKINTNPNNIIVGKSILDYEGRPAISLLPIPIQATKLDYVQNIALNSVTNKIYRASDFDSIKSTSNVCEAPVLDSLASTSLAYQYYSPLNPNQTKYNKFIPNANGYPFIHTEISPENSKKIFAQGGAGKELQINKGHQTSFTYVGANQTAINRLFGSEVGNAKYYQNVYTKDPNGQVSVSVNDYNGKVMATSLLGSGVDSSTIAIDTIKIPADTTSIDLIQGVTQLCTGNDIILNASYYNEASDFNDIKYTVTMNPFVTGCLNKNLIVGARYHYEVLNNCMDTLMTRNGVLGTSGIVANTTPITNSVIDNKYMLEGKYIVNKTLTINTNDVADVVDTFLADPNNCLLSENYFIKKAVEAQQLPCPLDTNDQCAEAKKTMIEELYPNHKYGTYVHGIGNSLLVGAIDTNSIFSNTCITYKIPSTKDSISCISYPNDSFGCNTYKVPITRDSLFCKYRYQSDCITFPDPIYSHGKYYYNIKTLPVDTFIFIFNDAIATALLPLHPEYCKLLGCFFQQEAYADTLNSIENVTVAQAVSRFNLQDIASHDPLLTKGVLIDSLINFSGMHCRIDSFVLRGVYCGGVNPIIASTSFNNIYQSICNSTTPFSLANADPTVLDYYYTMFIQAYIANRTTIKAKMMYSQNLHCGPCDTNRMRLIPAPVFPPFPPIGSATDTNALGQTMGNILSQIGNDTNVTNATSNPQSAVPDSAQLFPSWAVGANNSQSLNGGVIDSMNAMNASQDTAACLTIVDKAMDKFKNCSLDPILLAKLKDSLIYNFCYLNYDWTPARVALIIQHCGIALNDICNPYIIPYNTVPLPMPNDNNLMCLSANYYTNATFFFNRANVKTSFTTNATQSFNLDNTNTFEQNIITKLALVSPYAIQLTNTYNTSNHQYEITINKAGYPTIAMKFWILNNSTNASAQVPFSAYTGFSFGDVHCLLNDYPYATPSHINLYSFGLTLVGTLGSTTTTVPLIGYNNGFTTLQTNVLAKPNKLLDYQSCVEVQRMYLSLKDSLDAWKVYVNHPNFINNISNQISYKTGKVYSDEDIKGFFKSCAYTDNVQQNAMIANFKLEFANTANADNTLANIATFLGYVPNYYRFKNLNGSNTETIYLSYDYMTDDTSYLKLKTFLQAQTTYSAIDYNYRYTNTILAKVYVPSSSALNFTSCAYLNSNLSITNTTPSGLQFYTSIMANAAYQEFTVSLIGSPSAINIANYTDSLLKYVYHNEAGAWVFNNYASFQNGDYYRIEKQQWRTHNYNTTKVRHDSLTNRLMEDSLMANMSSLVGQYVTYGDANFDNKYDVLNISNPANYSSNAGYALLQGLLGKVNAYLLNTGKFAIATDSIVLTIPANDPIFNSNATPYPAKLYKCGGTVGKYLIKYYDQNDQLYTVFYSVPTGLGIDPMLLSSKPNSLVIGPGDSITKNFHFDARGQYSAPNTYPYSIEGYTNFNLGSTLQLPYSLLAPSGLDGFLATDYSSCEGDLITQAITAGKLQYATYIDTMRTHYINAFIAQVKGSISEKFEVQMKDLEYYFTLYYYDQAGNLTKTVPPAGVNRQPNTAAYQASVEAAKTSGTLLKVNHTKTSEYFYNSFNQVYEQRTPDGGTSKFFYDALGRIVFSQNAKQQPLGKVTYSLYDALGRIYETGEIAGNTAADPIFTNTWSKTLDDIKAYIQPRTRNQVVATVYDEEAYDLSNKLGMSAQLNLRKRVSASKYFTSILPNVDSRTDTLYEIATYYSYDVLGNVQTLTHDFRALLTGVQRFKRIDYDYDIASGKVNTVSYNKGFADQFYQRYAYDADNRLTTASTSKDGVYWDRDASYQYYLHGPLARLELGDLNVQGVDYAYTIQGWLKAINTDVIDTAADMGKDGNGSTAMLKDVYALSLDYFKNDYQPIGGTNANISHIPNPTKGLYNGNIARQNLALKPFDNLNKNYTYDPLNRILHTNYNVIAPQALNYAITPTDEFKEKFSYDLDGNIESISRYGNKVAGIAKLMDSLQYFYNANGTNLPANAIHATNQNRLNDVYDYANQTVYSNDVPYHTDVATNPVTPRFTYDAIGNLTQDQMNGINTIDWNLYGKVSTVSLPNNASDAFSYDATGNRVSKSHSYYKGTSKDTLDKHTEIYVREASGNILAIIKNNQEFVIKTNAPIACPWHDYLDHLYTQYPDFHLSVKEYLKADPYFSQAVIAAVSSHRLSNSVIRQVQAGVYFTKMPSVFLNTILYRPSTLLPIIAQNQGILVDAMNQLDSKQLISSSIDASSTKDQLRQLLSTMQGISPDVMNEFANSVNIHWEEQNPSDSIQVYMDAYAQDPDLFTNNLRNSIEQMTANNSVEDFKSQVLSSLMSDRDFDVQDGSNAQTAKHYMLCTALYNYILLQPNMFAQLVNTSIQPQNDMYMDSLMAVSDSNTLLQMAYTLSPDNTIDALYANAGRDAMLSAICTIPDLTQQKLHWLFGSKYDFDPAPWSTASTTTTTLIKQQTYLAEHHLYGSSRLGIKKYLPNHYCYNWALGSTSNISADSSSLNQIQIWYNPAINDFIKSYIPAYTSATQLDKQPWTSYNVIGLKNYELTNHLGNVQATILDRYTRRTNGAEDTSYHVYNTDIKTATDYYPFGSPMPGRYTQDTASQSFVVMAPLVVHSWDVATTLQSILGSFVPDNTGVYMQNTSPPISHVVVNKGSYTSGVNFNWGTFLTLPNMIVGKHYQLYINNAKSIGNFYRINGAMIINTATTPTNGMNMIDFICTATTENFVIEAQMFTTATNFVIDSALLLVENNVNTTVATVVTSAGDDEGARFGFNGIQKLNEIAGEGNHYTALFGEYESRLGRRWNRDPKPNPSLSGYSVFGNNPIFKSDVLLDSPSNNNGGNNYKPVPRDYKKKLPGFPESERLKNKQGARPSWDLGKGWHGEWDSQHGEVEVYDKNGSHQGAYDPESGVQLENPIPKRIPTYKSIALGKLKAEDIAKNNGVSPSKPLTKAQNLLKAPSLQPRITPQYDGIKPIIFPTFAPGSLPITVPVFTTPVFTTPIIEPFVLEPIFLIP